MNTVRLQDNHIKHKALIKRVTAFPCLIGFHVELLNK